jgi:translation elongation factor EF-Tu-like GTPase
MAQPRAWHASALLRDGMVLIVGGSTTNGSILTSVELFDPATSTLLAGSSMGTARAGASATTMIDGRVLVAGGKSATAELATAEIYDAFAGTFEPVPT